MNISNHCVLFWSCTPVFIVNETLSVRNSRWSSRRTETWQKDREMANRLTGTESATSVGLTRARAQTLVETDSCPEAAIYRGRRCDGWHVESALAETDTHDRLKASKMLSCWSSCAAESRQEEKRGWWVPSQVNSLRRGLQQQRNNELMTSQGH